MPLTEAIPVRFTEDVAQRLKAVSDDSGIPVAHLVRIATEDYLNKIDKAGKIEIDVTPSGRRYPKHQRDGVAALNEPSSKVDSVGSKLLKKGVASVMKPSSK